MVPKNSNCQFSKKLERNTSIPCQKLFKIFSLIRKGSELWYLVQQLFNYFLFYAGIEKFVIIYSDWQTVSGLRRAAFSKLLPLTFPILITHVRNAYGHKISAKLHYQPDLPRNKTRMVLDEVWKTFVCSFTWINLIQSSSDLDTILKGIISQPSWITSPKTQEPKMLWCFDCQNLAKGDCFYCN